MIVGAGLLGGSLLAALQPYRVAAAPRLHLTAVSSTNTIEALRQRAWSDACFTYDDIGDACAGADLVLLCTPLLTIRAQLDAIAAQRHRLARGAIVSDVGSTKGDICAHGAAAFPADGIDAPRFVGGHPMAGSEKAGLAAADPLLYQSALWVLCPPPDLPATRLTVLRAVVQAAGARIAILDPALHDAAVARISHVPQVLASVLSGWAGGDDALDDTALTLAAGGFRDMTRLALSSYDVWRDIIATNRKPIADGLAEMGEQLTTLAATLRTSDLAEMPSLAPIEAAFRTGAAFRRRFHMPRKGILHDLAEFVVRLDDRPGQLLALFTPLASAGINVQDLEILKVREGESGTVLMGFGTPELAAAARELLIAAGFAIYER
ncbi:MAG: prephenate dehydrogenase/arogenate dehydrogenase family protein [Gemmatimonadota bacterium]